MALTQIKTNAIADDAVTTDKMASGTDGRVITYDASGNPTTVGPGTDGQVLTSTGAGSPPAFETLPASNNYTHPNHSGEVTSTADGAQVVADDVIDEANLKVDNSPTNDYVLTAKSSAAGGLTWAEVSAGVTSDAQGNTVGGTSSGDSFTGTDAENNTLYGVNSGTAITSGDDNVAIGKNALDTLTTGEYNVAVGANALDANVSGSGNVALGKNALVACTSSNNVAIGIDTLKSMVGNSGCVAIGYKAGEANADDESVFIGDYAGYQYVNGNNGRNVVIGNSAGTEMTGGQNVAIGFKCGRHITSGYGNVFMGSHVKYESGSMLTGEYNVSIGYYSFVYATSGAHNSLLGTNAGLALTSGSNNVCLGSSAGRTSSPSGNLTTHDDRVVLGNNDTSELYCADTSISSSDQRDKTDITDWTHGLDWINKLKPITYRWDKRSWYNEYNEKGDVTKEVTPDGSKKRARLHLGFRAQDVLAVEQADGYASKKDDMLLINLNTDDTAYGMKYERLVVVLTKAVQELSAKNDALEARIAALESA